MREPDFKQWMRRRGIADVTIKTRIAALQRVERDEKIDLDNEFQSDRLASLIQRYTYTTQDEKNNRENPTNLKLSTNTLAKTLAFYKSHLNQYRQFSLSGGSVPAYEPENNDSNMNTRTDTRPPVEDRGATFGLEADLQFAVRENIAQLDPTLEIIDNGAERKVTSGFIDILAKDNEGRHVIIELKAGTATDSVVAQTLGYMGDIAEEDETEVRGIIVAADFNQRVQSAARAIPNLELKTYSYNFEFN